ncbi:uncharacterized protein LOC106157335 [Lingula anatina]|uniref:receptor protein-tyrosine kinase n=1 Tax=Lingula anatina TaxID=7574 RepID=A0A1S3HQV5_LINAN|nr:uncharacterized protein LOC106157335 [Lingula anatina]XP_013388417.1 uncharacterized protein LOC106157335 [Lingula anatina]XP_023932153.1 uncharacterized protein LOC106157335 [Lingula anatina]XP_023932156.1 uncharacterized protein LOC106157335 [Lingula anatina]XP_023932157.1 uncharacterized protein LOC106157335 [Lingula anatina]|eukprot:XP_013388416.1 uncharacterized protein LOC106157335 [Lingula anatina]
MESLLPWLLLVAMVTVCSPRCLPEITDPKRHLYYKNGDLPIRLESSNRVSHKLANHILKILLEEKVNYQKVEIKDASDPMNPTKILNRISGCVDSNCSRRQDIPETMVNIEVWMPAGFNMEPWADNDHVKDCGPLGPVGRYGWYLPNFFVKQNWIQRNLITDHWRALQSSSVTRLLDLSDARNELLNLVRKTETLGKEESGYYCSASYCSQGQYSGATCGSEPCAVLVSDSVDSDMDTLKNQIDNLNLSVKVAWVGKRLERFVHQRTIKGKPTLFFHFTPSELTASNNYTNIKFPRCTRYLEHPIDCDFEINQLSKVVWPKLEKDAEPAFHVIQKMTFTQQQYMELLQDFEHIDVHFNGAYQEVACQWVKKNSHIWSQWIPENLANKTKIYLGGMFSLSRRHYFAPGVYVASKMAADLINNDTSLLKNYKLEVVKIDTKCGLKEGQKAFIEMHYNSTYKLAGILGPDCADIVRPIARLTTTYDTVMISFSAGSIHLGNRLHYPYFFRTIPPVSEYSNVYAELFKLLDWQQVAVLTYEKAEEYLSLDNPIKIVYEKKIPADHSKRNIPMMLDEIKSKNGRIIIGTFYEMTIAQDVMCEAYRKDMTAFKGFQWFLTGYLGEEWWDTDYYRDRDKTVCSTKEMLEAVNGSISINHAMYDRDDVKVVGNMTVAKWKKELERHLGQHKRYKDNPHVTYAYDAVWVYGKALDSLLSKSPAVLGDLTNKENAKKLVDEISKVHFQGVSGQIFFKEADRSGIVLIKQLIHNKSRVIGRYLPKQLDLEEKDITWLWPGGKIPDGRQANSNQPVCSIEDFRAALGVSCDVALVIANIIGFGLLIMLLIVVFSIIKRRYDLKFRRTRERMEELGLLSDTLNWLSLDEWELPRDKVVLNRKLGEGAFGTVYGGESFIDDSWVAVAVKTLKIGSSVEEKLDFLSEAETMKRFNHDNIVRLLGVCTRGEPAYAVMEFMLYGDLKTYLLARRQLVGKTTPEAEDVSAIRLTAMALDVAHGLHYLSALHFVHRDLACRNCLVHMSKTVKIGDFGMTRPIFDHDYYRFNKKGMLPVRWMSPESLTDGKFTYKSDIWSFAILLYEIVTFGSFPYQGLTNNQVLEFVKNGNTLELSDQASPKLKLLLKACWEYEQSKRPDTLDIIGILEANPTLITPILDAPLSAVITEESKSLNINIPVKSKFGGMARRRQMLRQSSSVSHDGRLLSFNGDVEPHSPNEPSSPAVRGDRVRHATGETVFIFPHNSEHSNLENFHLSNSNKSMQSLKLACSDRGSVPNGLVCHQDSMVAVGDSSNNMIQLSAHRHSLEEKGDSDYCSDNSKEMWNHVSQV